ncbi:hypothetical protein EDD11_002632 [Mortierella claussenii]|nr:hypothetical protein EDD11_002632 [Mortierella claussenii]
MLSGVEWSNKVALTAAGGDLQAVQEHIRKLEYGYSSYSHRHSGLSQILEDNKEYVNFIPTKAASFNILIREKEGLSLQLAKTIDEHTFKFAKAELEASSNVLMTIKKYSEAQLQALYNLHRRSNPKWKGSEASILKLAALE